MEESKSATLDEVRERWRQAERNERDLVYFREVLPVFRPHFRAKPLKGARDDMPSPTALVSVLGFSWQPVALMAAWVDPQHVLVIGSRETVDRKIGDRHIKSALPDAAGVPLERFEWRMIDDPGEEEIYREVRDFVQRHGLDPHRVVLDPTGGKKSMSASAALAGFLAGVPLVYVDYAVYDPELRAPLATTEYPRLLRNPLDVFGDVELGQVTSAFDRGDFGEAVRRAAELALRLYEPREAETLRTLAEAYGAWDRFDFTTAAERLDRAAERLHRFGAKWSWRDRVAEKLEQHRSRLGTLSKLAAGEKPPDDETALAMIVNHLSAARRARRYGALDRAVLLAYGTVERYVDWMLWRHFGLDDEAPDYGDVEIDRERYDQIGKMLFPKYEPRDLPAQIMLGNGLQLLATLRDDLMPRELLWPLRGLMNRRNKLPVEHGLSVRPVEDEDVERCIDVATRVVALAWPGGADSLKAELEALDVPLLRTT